MGGSNEAWGELAKYDDGHADIWDSYDPIPEPGTNILLDEFVARKHITHGALVRIGAQLPDDRVLAVAFAGGIKFRDLLTDNRWSLLGSVWHEMKIVQHGPERSDTVIVAEGETDGAWLSDHCPYDVAILPAGANPKPHTAAYVAQLADYERVLLGQDSDRAGEEGAQAFMDALTVPYARYPVPKGVKDWCEWNPETMPLVPEPTEPPPADVGDVLTDKEREVIRHELLRMQTRRDFDRSLAVEGMLFPGPEDTLSAKQLAELEIADERQRIEGLAGVGQNLTLTAPNKTGKTVSELVIHKALLGEEGTMLFDEFRINVPLTRNVGLWNLEMEPRDMRQYLMEVGLDADDRMRVANWKGVARFSLLTDEGKAFAVNWLRENDVEWWHIDSYARILAWAGIGENENTGGLQILTAIDEIKKQAGVDTVCLTHHTGREGEHSRGAIVIDDWPDVKITLAREDDRRYMYAEGRGVKVDEGRLMLIKDERPGEPVQLVYSKGSRARDRRDARDAEVAEIAAEVGPELRNRVCEKPGEINHGEATAIISDFARIRSEDKQRVLDQIKQDQRLDSRAKGPALMLWPMEVQS